jgi:hypothetical protein
VDATRALDQIAEIHRQIAKGEVYRGYRSVPMALSGAIGLCASWLQPHGLAGSDPGGFVVYWTSIAVAAAFVGSSEIIYNYAVKEDASARRATRQVVGQFLPNLAAGALITVAFVQSSATLVPLLPGIWAICFALGTFACRPYLPRATGWIGVFYLAAGTALLSNARGAAPVTGWWVGGTFGAGQLLAAIVLWWNLERS